MPRKLHSAQSEYPYHVCARSHNGTWFRIPAGRTWQVMSFYLKLAAIIYEIRIHSFVMMSNHFHLIVSTPQANLSEAMNYFMRETAKEINRLSNSKDQVFGRRYARSIITSNQHFEHVYKYVYRNPVTAGIVQSCEVYEFSTLHGLLGQSKVTVPVVEDTLLFDGTCPERILQWLNTKPSDQNYEVLRKALKRNTLKFPKNKWGITKHTLDQRRF